MSNALIIDAVRTPRGIGKAEKGALAQLHPQRLLATSLQALQDRNHLETSDVDDVIIGCSSQFGKQGSCIARMGALDAGYSEHSNGISIDRFCGSGISSVSMGAFGIMSGMQDLVVTGGVEMMSYVGSMGGAGLLDAGNLHLRTICPQPHQGVAADMIATLDNISRETLDKFAVESQRRAARAIEEKRFSKSLVPVYNEDGSLLLDQDEHPRPSTTLESLAGLEPAFGYFMDVPMDDSGETFGHLVRRVYPDLGINHVHHAGNSSGVVDGSAAVLLASPQYAKSHNLIPRARVVAVANAGGDPTLMLNEPIAAVNQVLKKAGMSLRDIDLFEINEAFAVVAHKFISHFELDPDICNVNGGAIALGHPIAATGGMLIGTVLDELERQDLCTGLVTMCAAGGMAPAIIIERI